MLVQPCGSRSALSFPLLQGKRGTCGAERWKAVCSCAPERGRVSVPAVIRSATHTQHSPCSPRCRCQLPDLLFFRSLHSNRQQLPRYALQRASRCIGAVCSRRLPACRNEEPSQGSAQHPAVGHVSPCVCGTGAASARELTEPSPTILVQKRRWGRDGGAVPFERLLPGRTLLSVPGCVG